jgi:hypothetical protein
MLYQIFFSTNYQYFKIKEGKIHCFSLFFLEEILHRKTRETLPKTATKKDCNLTERRM